MELELELNELFLRDATTIDMELMLKLIIAF